MSEYDWMRERDGILGRPEPEIGRGAEPYREIEYWKGRAERAEARAKLAELKAENALVMVRALSGVRYLRERAERAEAALRELLEDHEHLIEKDNLARMKARDCLTQIETANDA